MKISKLKANRIMAIAIMIVMLASAFSMLISSNSNTVNTPAITPNNIIFHSKASINNTIQTNNITVKPFDIGSTVNGAISNLTNDMIHVFDSFFQGLVNIVVNATSSAVGGVLSLFGIPFHQWAKNVSQQGLIIPIIFVGVLGIAGAIGYFFFIIYGFEGDIRGGEEDIGHEEENVEEEE